MDREFRFVDLSLPVPLDRVFTYRLPETLRHRTRTGCRLLAPFGGRKLTGVAVRVHDDEPEVAVRDALRLIDAEPVFDEDLLRLAQFIANYYCAPLGEVLRTMAPLGGELRKGRIWMLTDKGHQVTRQLVMGGGEGDPAVALLRVLEARPLAEATLERKVEGAKRLLKSLEKKGLVAQEQTVADRDPLRAPAGRLRVEFGARPEGVKLLKAERELVAFLELHPGGHNLEALEGQVKGASQAARALARRGLLEVVPEAVAGGGAQWAKAPHEMNGEQRGAFEAIRGALQAGAYQTFLLHGVTGSGKTEVYLNAIDAALQLGRGALLLVPEIALTPAVAGQFHARFGDRVAILHSAFNDSERAQQWRRLRSGAARVGVGTRSAVFAPVQDLGLIIVDEEHDNSYKQEENPRYHGRDVAIIRAHMAGGVVVLGSATPSLESRHNVERGKSALLTLGARIGGRPMPQVEIVDMREEFLETRQNALFSRRMVEAVNARLEAGEQTILLMNRRGYSSTVTCRACGERVECPNCAVGLTYHRRDKRLLCHYCGHAERIPEKCGQCGSDHIYFAGSGSEKVEDELSRAFPRARVARLDRDTVTTKHHYEHILGGFREGNYDILVGTQMIAKGHDIPNVTFVGVVSADTGLGMPDFRAAERTFQLLTQVAGRAGRHHLPGHVLLQTINPDHYAVRCAAAQDYGKFYEKELEFRRLMRYPPFSAMANVLVRAEKQEDALRLSSELARILGDPGPGMKVLGPAEAPVPRLKNEFRYQMLIKTTSRPNLNERLRELRRYAAGAQWPATALVIDVDPLSLL
ncbi:MAG: primosomal protein N' [Bryobacteraceae bacterium]|nr:primosomal protein N' [Bryobacteraceae bacterium]